MRFDIGNGASNHTLTFRSCASRPLPARNNNISYFFFLMKYMIDKIVIIIIINRIYIQ
jgi:hypothetical protein